MVELLRRLTESVIFHRVVIGLIVASGIVMGIETWPALEQAHGTWFAAINKTIQVLFVIELALRIGAYGRKPHDFFKSGWNVFDFGVITLSLLPAAGPLATVARLARVLRAGRLVSGMPELRLIIGTMLRSIPSMGHVIVLLGLLVYIYGIIGHHLFATVAPQQFGHLGRAVGTLFVVITLEGWVEIMQASAAATPWAWLYYVSFIVIAVFVVINLFIAVVINNLEKARREDAETAGVTVEELALEVRNLAEQMGELTNGLLAVARARKEAADGAAGSASVDQEQKAPQSG